MKKILPLLLLVCGFANAQIINIPDANFKAKLLASSNSQFNYIARDINGNAMAIDANINGQIEQSEALAVYELNVRNANIANLTGIQFFTNLKALDCSHNPLTSLNTAGLVNLESLSSYNCTLSDLNLSASPNLKYLNLFNNDLTWLNVSGLLNLEQLSFSGNQIISIDIAGLTNLEVLQCEGNLLTVLEVTNLTNLTYLSCANNLLTTLNVSNLMNLTGLDFGNPGLGPVNVNDLVNLTQLYFHGGLQTTMDISNLVNLEILTFSNTNLTAIDASNNPGIMEFTVAGNTNLTYLNVKDGTTGNYLWVEACPNLLAICANEADVAPIYAFITSQGNNANVSVTSYCTFTPGGDYNTITGSIKYDFNNNGCSDDNPQPFIKMNINDGTQQGSSFADQAGNYKFYTAQGNYTITPHIENPAYFTVSPANATINFPVVDNSVAIQDFCITANGVHADVEVVIAPVTPARPGFDAVYKIVYKNKGNQAVSGHVFFTYDDVYLDLVSSVPTQDITLLGYLGYQYTNLMPFENREILVTLNVNSPTDTPAVNIGDILDFNAHIIVSSSSEETLDDNVFDFAQTVVGAYDPNDIQCIEGNAVGTDQIGEYLHYLIRFENTGNFEATNIVVKNSINTAQFDANSLRVLNSSHPVDVRVTGNTAEFIFQNISLDSGGHGNILLKIQTLETLSAGTTVAKKTDIFFDYNFPIETNTAETTFQTLGIDDVTIDKSIYVFPNPAADFITVKADHAIQSIELYDVQGRILMTRIAGESSETIELSGYTSGVYFVRIATVKGSKTEKLIKK